MNSPLLVLITFFLLTLLSGCTNTNHIQDKVDNTQKNISRLQKIQAEMIEPKFIHHRDYVYLGKGESIPLSKRKVLPSLFRRKKGLLIPPSSLKGIAAEITREFGVLTRITPKLGMSSSSGGTSDLENILIPIRHFGTLERLLDVVSSQFNIDWKYDKGIIDFYRYETRKFVIAEFQGKRSGKISMSNSVEDTTGSLGGSTQETSRSLSVDPWGEINSTIKGMLSENGSVTTAESAGLLIVTDLPHILDDIQNTVDSYNQVQLSQISIELNIYTVSVTDNKSNSFDLNLLFKEVASKLELKLNSSVINGMNSPLTAAIFEPTQNASTGFMEGSKVMLGILDSYGRATLAASGSGISLNNREMPIQVTSRDGYLAKREIEIDENTEKVTIEAGFITSGLSLIATPHIINNDLIMLDYSIDLSFLRDLKVLRIGNNMDSGYIQVPDTRTRRFMQSVAIRSGSMIVLGGIDRIDNKINDETKLTGKSEAALSSREIVLVTLRATNISGSVL
ncbi:MAG: hypothetical protein ABW148_10255 [Sedimenticola sp.]